MKKILIFIFCTFALTANALEKKTTFDEELFKKAQSEGKVVIISSWIKYCSSCASQMKVLKTVKNGVLINFLKENPLTYEEEEVIRKKKIYKVEIELFTLDQQDQLKLLGTDYLGEI